MSLVTLGRRLLFPTSLVCLYASEKNSDWENKLQQDYRQWRESHEEYQKAVKLVSKTQVDKLNICGKAASDELNTIMIPHEIVKKVRQVKESYESIYMAIVTDILTTYNDMSHDTLNSTNENDEFACLSSATVSIKEKEEFLKTQSGMKNSYKSYVIAYASAKEAIARDKMLDTLHTMPGTYLFTDDNKLIWNTNYMQIGGFVLLAMACISFAAAPGGRVLMEMFDD